MIPRGTYRIQFHKGFTFADAIPLAGYLKHLGVSHLYASPILTARVGSPHGYDVIDFTSINSELGGERGFRALVAELRKYQVGTIVDFVPNHMAAGSDNPWWMDVLENGSASRYATMFDIDWDAPDPMTRGRVFLPVLGTSPEEAIAAREITLQWDETLQKFVFCYYEHRLPVRREDYSLLMGKASDSTSAPLAHWNEPDALADIIGRQHYRLAHWQSAPDTINWRRFFDVTELAALRMEDDPVFEAVHAKIFQLYAEGQIDGVRIDHIDGLTDPAKYCRSLRARLDALMLERPAGAPSGPAYIVVEKILAAGERLPLGWGINGTTGYDFMNDVSALQHDDRGKELLTNLWVALSGRPRDFDIEEGIARSELLHTTFDSHLRTAAASFRRLGLFAAHEVEESALQGALRAIFEQFRAYRTYTTGLSAEPPPGPLFDRALEAARQQLERHDRAALDFIAATIRGEMAEFGAVARRAVRLFNQLAAPVAAKAVEDTAFFRYGRMLSRNDVGFSPAEFSCTSREFQARVSARMQDFPYAMLATATHDHKRGEDVRARLAVLSECGEEWEREVRQWFELNARFRESAVDPGDEYQLYQTLVGTWPADANASNEALVGYMERILQWREKSLREAKLRTSWTAPDHGFESAHVEFVKAVLDPTRSRPFLSRLHAFTSWVAMAGACNSLTQCILRCTLPGVPDLYQGCEFWDLSLVDPDNRRAIDFDARRQALASTSGPAALLPHWQTGHVKQRLIAKLLNLRRQMPGCFSDGTYVPLTPAGTQAARVIAFERVHRSERVLVAVPRLCARACAQNGAPSPSPEFWGNTTIRLPAGTRVWRSVLSQAQKSLSDEVECAQLFTDFPGAILIES
jgi:(1->4)-alpha-D-glucan 1-alpha-D-glucosylmutase